MASRGPWSVKGIEARAREAALSAARSEGITLGDYLNRLLLEAEAEDKDMSLPQRQTSAASGPANANLEELEKITRRIEAVEARSTLAITGIDQSVVGLLARLENTDTARSALEGRLEETAEDLRETQALLEQRLNRVEADDTAAQGLRSLKMLETALERLATNVAEQRESTEKAQSNMSRIDSRMDNLNGEMDRKLSAMQTHVDDTMETAANSIAKAVEKAELRTEGTARHLSERMSKMEADLFEEKRKHDERLKSMETRLGGTLSNVTSQIDQLSDGMSETLKKSHRALEEAQKQQGSIEAITERLNRAETTTDAAMRELEHHFNRLDSRLEEYDRDLEGGRISDLKLMVEDRIKSASSDLAETIKEIRSELAEQIEVASAAPNAAFAEINNAVSEMHKRMKRAEKRQTESIEAIGEEFARLTEALDRRVRQIEQRNDSDLGSSVREQIESLANNFHKRIVELEDRDPGDNESLKVVSDRMTELADALDKRVNASEERSAAAIRDFTEHVTTLTKNLSAKQEKGIQELSGQIQASEKRQTERMEEALSGVRDRIAQVEEATASAVSPIQKAMAGFVERLQAVEDFAAPPGTHAPRAEALDLPDFEDTLKKVSLKSDLPEPSAKPAKAEPAKRAAADIAAFPDIPDIPDIPEPVVGAKKPAPVDDDPWAMDDGIFAPPADHGFDEDDEFTADLPPLGKEFDLDAAETDLDAMEDDFGSAPAGPNDYLARARAAAKAGQETGRSSKHSPARAQKRGSSKIPLVAAASVLALTAAGTVGYLSMRGKQDAQKDPIIFVPSDVDIDTTLENNKADTDLDTDMKDLETKDPKATAKDASPPPENKATKPSIEDAAVKPAKIETVEPKALPDPTPVKIAPVPKPQPEVRQTTAKLEPKPQATPQSDKTVKAKPAPAPTPTVRASVTQYQQGMAALNEGQVAKAAQLIRASADAGEPIAQYRLSKLYERGQGVPRDLTLSRAWTTKAANGGNVKAMHDLAVFYAEGEGGEQSYAGAVKWFRQAADYGLLDSQYNLGILYEQGMGVDANKAEALYWFRVAQKLGDATAAKKVKELVDLVTEDEAVKTALLAGKYKPKASNPDANGRFSVTPAKPDATKTEASAQTEMVRSAQVLLNSLGYNAGTPDGQFGTQTREAILTFQAANGLPQSAAVTPTLLRQLRSVAPKI